MYKYKSAVIPVLFEAIALSGPRAVWAFVKRCAHACSLVSSVVEANPKVLSSNPSSG